MATVTVQSLLNAATYDSYTVTLASDTVNDLKNDIASATGVNTAWFNLVLNGEVLTGTDTLQTAGVADGDSLRTANIISRLATKEAKQQAKLQLAKLTRAVDGRPDDYDLSELPTYYSGNTVVDNPNTGGLLLGRPWALNTVVTSGLVMSIDSALIPSGTVLEDQTANNNDATLVGAVWNEANYFVLDGTNDYIRSPNLISDIGSPDTFSAEVWVYPTNYGVVLSITNTTTPDTAYHYSAMEFTNSGGKPLPEFGIWGGMSGIVGDSGTALEFNTWYNMAITYNAATNTMKGYINGAQVATASVNYDSPSDGGETLHHLLFGATDFTNMGDGTYFNGRMGDIRVYNTELSAAQITSNYNNTKVKYGL